MYSYIYIKIKNKNIILHFFSIKQKIWLITNHDHRSSKAKRIQTRIHESKNI